MSAGVNRQKNGGQKNSLTVLDNFSVLHFSVNEFSFVGVRRQNQDSTGRVRFGRLVGGIYLACGFADVVRLDVCETASGVVG